jgi:hypothetical protein
MEVGAGQHGVNGIAGMVCEIIAAHALLGLEMTDHWFNGGTCCLDSWRLKKQRPPFNESENRKLHRRPANPRTCSLIFFVGILVAACVTAWVKLCA